MSADRIIRAYAQENGLIVGVCGVEPFGPMAAAPFMGHALGGRADPADVLPGARSIVVVGVGYNRELLFEPDGEERGHFSLGAVGIDYHLHVHKKLSEIESVLKRNGIVCDCYRSVDTGPLPEKKLAVRAGLGWVGKHGLVISEAYGSFFNVGYIISTLSPEHDLPGLIPDSVWPATRGLHCGECNLCVKACPGGALIQTAEGDVFFDYKRCVSYLTQSRTALTEAEQRVIGVNLYGCDACQKACPHNLGTYVGAISDINYIMPRLSFILSLTASQYKARYRSTAVYWRGHKVLLRNAGIALKNLRGQV